MRDYVLGLLTASVIAGVYAGWLIKQRFDVIEDELSDLAGAICDITIEGDDGFNDDPDGGIPVEAPQKDKANDNDHAIVTLKPRKAS